MASLKEFEMMFHLNAELGGNFSSAFIKAQKEINALGQEITAANKLTSDISAFQKQQGAVDASGKKLEVLRQQYDNIQREMNETGNASSDLQNKLLAKQLQIDKTSASLQSQTARLEQMRSALQAAGINTDELDNKIKDLTDQVNALKKKQEEAADEADNFGSRASAAFGVVGQAIAAAGIAVALKKIAEWYGECIEVSMEFESAMTNISKTTDMSYDELEEMANAVQKLSTEIPITTEELAAVAETAGQLGIAKDNLLDFSTIMSMLATATTMTADEAATMLAQFANITRMNPAYYSNLASAIVDLGNNYATTEQKITEMSQGIAASASLAGMSEADMVGLSAAVTSLGIETQAGSTSMSKLISTLMTAVETGEGLTDYARIANMSADEFSTAWGKNAVGALQAFVTGLADTERNGKSATVVLSELGITEARMQRMVLSLANSGDLLNRTVATANTAWAENNALTAEAEKRYATTQSQLTLMQNSYNNLKVTVGDQFTPELQKLYAISGDVMSELAEFVERNPELMKAATIFIAAIGAGTVALTGYAAVAKGVKALNLTTLFTGPAGAVVGAIAGIAALTAAIVGITAAMDNEQKEILELNASSREEYYHLQDLKEEYAEVSQEMGENSDEALYLAWQIEELNNTYEAGKRTLSEYIEECEALNDRLTEVLDSNRKTYEEVGHSEGTTLSLLHRLEELASQTDKTVATQEEMRAIVAELNEIVPDLAFSYEDVADGMGDWGSAIEMAVKAQAATERYKAAQEGMVDAYNVMYDAEKGLGDLRAEQALALAEYERQYAIYESQRSAHLNWVGSGGRGNNPYEDSMNKAKAAYKAAEEAADSYGEQIADLESTHKQAAGSYEEYKEALADYAEATFSAEDGAAALNERIAAATAQMTALARAYTEAYNAALESVQGQYALWDEAAEVVATSAGTINTALESQITYWQDYNSNLQALTDRSSEIEGLSEMIASFADGSSESVNAVAGMATATDEELVAMVENWNELQEAQKLVADGLADIEADFTATMDRLQNDLAADIEAMDLGEDAAESGKATIQGFIDGAIDMLPEVQTAFSQLAAAAKIALSVSGETYGTYAMPGRGYASGTENARRGFALVGEKGPELVYFGGGEQVLNADETAALWRMEREMQPVVAAHQSSQVHVMSAEAGDRGANIVPVSVQNVFHIEGNASQETIDRLREYGDQLKSTIVETIEEYEEDRARRAYR